jgi:hypothetical protein
MCRSINPQASCFLVEQTPVAARVNSSEMESDRSFRLTRLPKEQQLKLSTLHCASGHAGKFRRLASHPELFLEIKA